MLEAHRVPDGVGEPVHPRHPSPSAPSSPASRSTARSIETVVCVVASLVTGSPALLASSLAWATFRVEVQLP